MVVVVEILLLLLSWNWKKVYHYCLVWSDFVVVVVVPSSSVVYTFHRVSPGPVCHIHWNVDIVWRVPHDVDNVPVI